MKTKRLKVTIKDGFQEQFIDFCKQNGINCKQYPIEALNTRFGVDDIDVINNLDYICIIEDMPTCGLD